MLRPPPKPTLFPYTTLFRSAPTSWPSTCPGWADIPGGPTPAGVVSGRGARGPGAVTRSGSAPPQQHRGHHEVGEVRDRLQHRRARPISDQAGQEAADHRLVAEDERGVPDRLPHGQEPQALKPADAGAEEPRGEQ